MHSLSSSPPFAPLSRLDRLLGHVSPSPSPSPYPSCSSSSCSSSVCPHSSSSSSSHLFPHPTAASVSAQSIATADLCDSFPDDVQLKSFHGQAYTLQTHEDNTLIRSTLENVNGSNRVLVIDGGGSLRCALVGDQLVTLALKQQWSGIVVYGAIRDSAVINGMEIGIKALGTSPVKSIKRKWGVTGKPVQLGNGPIIVDGDWIYSDQDGILVSKKKLH